MTSTSTSISVFDRERHIKYFAHHLVQLPYPYTSLDTNRLTLVHFAAHALEMLGVWDDPERLSKLGLNKQAIIDWIYNLQVCCSGGDNVAGFTGGTFLGLPFDDNNATTRHDYHFGHVAMTYTAIGTLTLLGDDLSRLHKAEILAALAKLQGDNGSFQCIPLGSEQDTRFLFCACAISYMLNDWSAVNIDKACQYVKDCRSFDGGIALIPGQVSHFEFGVWSYYTCTTSTYININGHSITSQTTY
jgi:geranylgeranyl transferase type-1 subunit beta